MTIGRNSKASALLGYNSEYWALFNIVIQLGAILAIVALYWRTFWAVLQGLLKFDPVSVRFVRNILVAFLPAAVIGLALHKQIEKLLGSPLTVAVALIVGGLAIIGIERTPWPSISAMSRHCRSTAAMAASSIAAASRCSGSPARSSPAYAARL